MSEQDEPTIIEFNVNPDDLFALLGKQAKVQERFLELGWDLANDDLDFVKMGHVQQLLAQWPETQPTSSWDTWAKGLTDVDESEMAQKMVPIMIEMKEIEDQLAALPRTNP